MIPTDKLIQERRRTHGSFEDNAFVSQKLKEVMHEFPNWRDLTLAQREALDMIALKIGRILSGKASEHDHWKDIAGYATLILTLEHPPAAQMPAAHDEES